MAEVGTWSWDHFLADERRFAGAKDGIWSSEVVGFGPQAGLTCGLGACKESQDHLLGPKLISSVLLHCVGPNRV
jgi:hypothetical protein